MIIQLQIHLSCKKHIVRAQNWRMITRLEYKGIRTTWTFCIRVAKIAMRNLQQNHIFPAFHMFAGTTYGGNGNFLTNMGTFCGSFSSAPCSGAHVQSTMKQAMTGTHYQHTLYKSYLGWRRRPLTSANIRELCQ